MKNEINVNAYFERIGYKGDTGPTLETLQGIVRHHSASIPFENVDVLLRRPIQLDLRSLEDKLVYAERGGYCFEQNNLLRAVLEALNFRVTGLAARVLLNAAPDVVPARQHMVLRIDLDTGAYIADVGFGGTTPTAPLRLETGTEQQTPHEVFRLITMESDFVLQARLGEAWKPLYRFDLHPQLLPDYEVSNWYVSTHPDSHFLRDLMVARAGSDARYTLSNDEFTIRRLDGPGERRRLTSTTEIRDVLQTTFRLPLPQSREIDSALDAVISRTRSTANV